MSVVFCRWMLSLKKLIVSQSVPSPRHPLSPWMVGHNNLYWSQTHCHLHPFSFSKPLTHFANRSAFHICIGLNTNGSWSFLCAELKHAWIIFNSQWWFWACCSLFRRKPAVFVQSSTVVQILPVQINGHMLNSKYSVKMVLPRAFEWFCQIKSLNYFCPQCFFLLRKVWTAWISKRVHFKLTASQWKHMFA